MTKTNIVSLLTGKPGKQVTILRGPATVMRSALHSDKPDYRACWGTDTTMNGKGATFYAV